MRTILRTFYLQIFIGFLAVGTAMPANGEEALALALYGGVHDVNESDSAGEFGVEVRWPLSWWRLTGVAGATTTEDEAFWGYAGVRRDFDLSPRWVLTPGFAISLYEQGDGVDLGGAVEFRSSIELAARIRERSRLGIALYHLSNAGIYDRNPGFNSVILSWSFGR